MTYQVSTLSFLGGPNAEGFATKEVGELSRSVAHLPKKQLKGPYRTKIDYDDAKK